MRREFFPTIKEFKDMGLTDYQINTLINYENIKHQFRNQFKQLHYYNAPNSIFFLDIKDTLYHSSGHGGSGTLGRAGDSIQIFMRDILALGSLLATTTGQAFTMDQYKLCEDESYKIKYNFPTNEDYATYKMDLPTKKVKECFTNQDLDASSTGPYKVVFISSDPVKTQKNIILFLLLTYKICLSGGIRFHLGSQHILQLEEIFDKSNCDFDTFISNLPPEYRLAISSYDKEKIQEIMDNITFLSTKDSNLTKAELMKNFLDKYNIQNGLRYDDYNIFACGDDYDQDGPMVELAFQLGGYGCLNHGGFSHYCQSESLRYKLYEKHNLETKAPLVSYGFSDFYNKAMDFNSLQRTWDLAETMQDINQNKKLILNRFKKTNHHIIISKED